MNNQKSSEQKNIINNYPVNNSQANNNSNQANNNFNSNFKPYKKV